MEKTIQFIKQMLKKKIINDYAVGGAMALAFYTEPAVTFDLDVFVFLSPTQQTKILLSLADIYDYCKSQQCKIENAHIMIAGIPVQFLPAHNPLIEEAVRQAVVKKISKTNVRVIALEYLMAIALQTGRAKDKVRVLQISEENNYDKKVFKEVLHKYNLLTAWRELAK